MRGLRVVEAAGAARTAAMRAAAVLALLLVSASPVSAAVPGTASPRVMAPLAAGDEAIVVTRHTVRAAGTLLGYEARIGRVPIRNGETGEVRGYIGFVAYIVPSTTPRPLTVAWNGGPTTASDLLHTELLGPRRIENGTMVENAETLLAVSDLVFMDPVGTGFSRPAAPGMDKEFLSTLGDFAATAEFVRGYRARFGAGDQPLFLLGESYGTWRVNGTTQLLTQKGVHVSGAILISGGVPGSLMPDAFQDAMYTPARTAAAFELKKLAPDLMADRVATLKAVDDCAYNTYFPALNSGVDKLTPEQREAIAQQLARYIGLRPDQVDRKTLVVTNNQFRTGLFDAGAAKALGRFDMRIVGPEPPTPARDKAFLDYVRGDLGYSTDLTYNFMETGYEPVGGPKLRTTGERWVYDHTSITPEAVARMNAGGGPPLSQPWLQNVMRKDPAIRVFVAAGRYDSLNMCEGNRRMTARLEPAVAARFTHACYEGGHMMYRDRPTRLQLSTDLAAFIRGAASAPAARPPGRAP